MDVLSLRQLSHAGQQLRSKVAAAGACSRHASCRT
jgi:hypothetical protein